MWLMEQFSTLMQTQVVWKCIVIGNMLSVTNIVRRRQWFNLTIFVGTVKKMLYKLELCVTNGTNDKMTCVLFNEAAVSLLKITADELVNRSLSEGVDDPNWIESYLNENLCSRRVIFVIKIDAYNLAPKFSSHELVNILLFLNTSEMISMCLYNLGLYLHLLTLPILHQLVFSN
ncbi:putative nucleic acid-binding protein [Helianthus anomalus]